MGSVIDIFVTIGEFVFSILDILFILRFYRHIYGTPRTERRILYGKAILLMITVTFVLYLILPPIRPHSIPSVTVLCSFLFLTEYPHNRQKKVLFCIITFVSSFLLLMLGDMILSPLVIPIPIPIIVVHMTFWLMLELILRIGRYEDSNIPGQLWILLIFISLSSLILLFIIWYQILTKESPYQLTTEMYTISILLFINLSLFVFFDRFSTLFHENQETALLEQQLFMQNNHYRELEETHKQLHTIRHDINNYLRTASVLAEKQGNNETLISYLNQISGQVAEIEQVISTGNENMDSVLNIKLAEMNRCHIPVTTEITVPPDMSFSFRQAVTILGNLLDNAAEACLAITEDERWSLIKICYINHALYIQIDNSCQAAVQWKNDVPLSTKADKHVHGLGIKNVKEIIGDVGTLSLKSDLNSFHAKVILYEAAPADQF